VNSHLPVGRLAGHLESLTRERAWLAVLVVASALAIADNHLREIALAPLYIPIICAACWTLGERAGYLVALLTAILAVAPHWDDNMRHSLAVLGMRTGVHVATYLFVAATVASFRRSFDRERYLALRDRTTGALNKEVFHHRARAALDAAARGGRTLLIAMLDLDDFRSINNVHGHAAGDAVLCAFAQGAADIIRRDDDFGRIGGDEFAFLISVHSAEDGRLLAATLHARLSAVLAETPYPVTCSMGALVIPPDVPRDEAMMMHGADQLMYAVKRAGKDAVEIGEAGAPSSLAAISSTPLRERTA